MQYLSLLQSWVCSRCSNINKTINLRAQNTGFRSLFYKYVTKVFRLTGKITFKVWVEQSGTKVATSSLAGCGSCETQQMFCSFSLEQRIGDRESWKWARPWRKFFEPAWKLQSYNLLVFQYLHRRKKKCTIQKISKLKESSKKQWLEISVRHLETGNKPFIS